MKDDFSVVRGVLNGFLLAAVTWVLLALVMLVLLHQF